MNSSVTFVFAFKLSSTANNFDVSFIWALTASTVLVPQLFDTIQIYLMLVVTQEFYCSNLYACIMTYKGVLFIALLAFLNPNL